MFVKVKFNFIIMNYGLNICFVWGGAGGGVKEVKPLLESKQKSVWLNSIVTSPPKSVFK